MSTDTFNSAPTEASPSPTIRDRGTSGVPTVPSITETGDGRLLNQVSALRDGTTFLQHDVERLHEDVRARELDERTSAAALRDPRELLQDLSHRHGLSWATIARLAEVSSTAVRKWRRGETISSSSRRSLARAVTFLQMLDEHASPIVDVGTWLEMPLSDQSTLTAVDVYVGGKVGLLLDHVAGRVTAHAVLDAYAPDWRVRHAPDSRFGVEMAEDGHLSLVERDR